MVKYEYWAYIVRYAVCTFCFFACNDGGGGQTQYYEYYYKLWLNLTLHWSASTDRAA
jgi:hypothetical protein